MISPCTPQAGQEGAAGVLGITRVMGAQDQMKKIRLWLAIVGIPLAAWVFLLCCIFTALWIAIDLFAHDYDGARILWLRLCAFWSDYFGVKEGIAKARVTGASCNS